MASSINASTSGGGGVITTADATGDLNLQSGGSTIVAVTSTGASVTGTLSASGVSTFAAGTALLPALTTTGDTNTGVWFPAADTIAASTAGTERMRIASDGTVLIGATATSAYFDGSCNVYKSGNIAFCAKTDTAAAYVSALYNSATTGNNLFLGFVTETAYNLRGGISYNRGAGLIAYNTTSDERLKENIVDASSALSKINSVKVRSFDWKETGNHVDFGVIAQELISIAPECVTEGQDNDDGTIKTSWAVDTSALVPTMIKAIQEQQTIINDLKARITALEGLSA